MRASQEAARAAAAARPPQGFGGLGRGGLQPAVTAPRPAALDPTGLATWDGAKMPTQKVTGGRYDVTVEQTQSRAILSWESFNLDKDTTLTFDQDGNKDWVVLNRVVGGLDARGRRTALLKPSEILGGIKADGAVLIMNQNGVIFGAGSQIRTTSLAVSTAEIGRGFRSLGAAAPGVEPDFVALTLAERNAEFLKFGLLGVRDSLTSGAEFHSEFTPYYDSVTLDDGRRSVAREEVAPEGAVLVEAGARIEGGSGGFILLNSTRVENAGEIVAPEGNVSLVANWGASLIASDGSGKNGNDPNYRGLTGLAPAAKIAPGFGLTYTDAQGETRTVNVDLGDVYGRNTGLIQADRGSIRVTENRGVLASTTSVARNGYIVVDRAMSDSVISIMADAGVQTVPQDPASIANFKASRVDIGYYVGAGALIVAPGGDVEVTGPPVVSTINPATPVGAGRVLIESGAVIDVGGLRDVLVPASRNAIRIGPLKGNELADNPKYRDSFLNGATVYVDPRRSGVREDGVAWVGSPLIEAESYYQQVGVRADELLTRGGSVTFRKLPTRSLSGDVLSDTIVEAGAKIDISGGSVRYEGGQVRTSKLVGADGRLYDIADADPLKMSFVGFASGFTVAHPGANLTESYSPTLRPNARTEVAYSEGRDGGVLDLAGAPRNLAGVNPSFNGGALVFEGTVDASVVVGERQLVDAVEGSGKSDANWDRRSVQGAPSELPAAGALRIGDLSTDGAQPSYGVKIVAGDDMPAPVDLAYGRDFAAIDAALLGRVDGVSGPRDPGSDLSPDQVSTTYLSSDMLSTAGFGQIEIARRGDVSIEAGASVRLADGGLFTVASGGSIRIDGSIIAQSGVVSLETSGARDPSGGRPLVGRISSLPDGFSPYDVIVNGTISVRGRWINNFNSSAPQAPGGAHLDGGSIVLFAGAGAGTTDPDGSGDPLNVRDISGSVLVNAGATLDLTGGGLVDVEGDVDASARGGSLALISEASYFQLKQPGDNTVLPTQHVGQVYFPGSAGYFAQPIPDAVKAAVTLDADAKVLSAGFGGGGTFTLVTPEFSFGEGKADVGTRLSLDFIGRQGFSNYEIASYKTKIVENKFRDFPGDTRSRGYDGFLETQTVTIGAGETLRLRNAVFSLAPSEHSARDLAALQGLATGGDLYSVVEQTTLDDAPGRDNAFYRQPVNLTLGGLIELKVAEGGAILGEAGARLTTPRLINEGVIRLPGGQIVQRTTLPRANALNPSSSSDPYAGLIPEADGTYLESTTSQDGVRTNADAYIHRYLLGELAADVGIDLRAGSVTDLKGVSLRDPNVRQGTRVGDSLSGSRILAGGSITAAAGGDRASSVRLYPTVAFSRFSGGDAQIAADVKRILPGRIVAAAGARINLDGASDAFSRPVGGGAIGEQTNVSTAAWSDAGSIIAPNGATLTGALIDARGGSAKARGGTLEVGDLVLTQADGDVAVANAISADLIARSGFDVVHARGSVTSIGDVDLTLGRAFFLTSAEVFDQSGASGAAGDAGNYASIGSGGSLKIAAPYVRLEGYARSVVGLPVAEAGSGSVSLSARQIDVVGGVVFDETVGSAELAASGDIRLVGQKDILLRVPSASQTFSDAIAMQLAAFGDLTFKANRVYPETGATALITSSGADATISFGRPSGPAPATPYSAGAKLTVQAAHIVQNGAIFTPHGSLTLGSTGPITSLDEFGQQITLVPATRTVALGAGGLTSVSGGTISIPYGVTTDLTEYYFTPGGADPLTQTPEKRLALGGAELSVERGATIDVSGGGDVFAYEFIPGAGGSRDVLDRLNPDEFTSNDGLAYPNGRQVYAIVPGLSDAPVAAVDPLFSAGYDNLGQTSGAGARIYIGGGAGLSAGWYTLLPAKYAVLPGGVRVVEQPGGPGVETTPAVRLPDGTVRVAGRYGQLGTEDWRWRRFDLQTQSVFKSYSNIALTSAQQTFAERAAAAGAAAPRSPVDAGSITFEAISRLELDGSVKAAAAKGGRGASVDIGGSAIYVVSDPDAVTIADGAVLADGAVVREIDGALVLCSGAASDCASGSADRLADVAPLLVGAGDLSGLGAETLLIGGSRVTRADGAVEIRTSAQRVVIANDASAPLYAPEILAAVGLAQNRTVNESREPVDPGSTQAVIDRDVRDGPSKTLKVLAGAVIEARGTVADVSTADYVAAGGYVGLRGDSFGTPNTLRRSSVGAVLRVANGPERMVRRDDISGDAFESATDDPALIASYQRRYAVDLDVSDNARLSGASVLADVGTYRNPNLSADTPAVVDEFGNVIAAAGIGWTPRANLSIGRGAAIAANVLTLGAGDVALTDRAIGSGLAITRDLVASIGAAGKVGRLSIASGRSILIDGGAWTFEDVSFTAPGLGSRDGRDVTIAANSFALGNNAPSRAACSGPACGSAKLDVRADEIVMGPGAMAVEGFDGGVTLTAAQGLFARGKGGLDVGSASLTINAPLIADRAFANADATELTLPATGLSLVAGGAIRISGTAVSAAPEFAGVPGSAISIKGSSVAVSGTRIRATAGAVELSASAGDVTISDGAVVEAPGYRRVFGEVTRSAPAGMVRLESVRGDVTIAAGSTVSVGGAVGKAGSIALVASDGAVTVAGELDGTAAEGDASLLIDTGTAFDLDGFAATAVRRNFDGAIAIRSGTGDLTLSSGRTLRGASVALTAEGGRVDLSGRIDTTGVTGGDVALFGAAGVRMRDGATIDTSASGYAATDSRQAKSGSVTIGTDGTGAIRLDAGSTIDVAADRSYDRLVPVIREGRTYYQRAAADQGGDVVFRAPIIEQGGADTADVTVEGRVLGAHEVVLEAFKRWDLDALADSGRFTGVTRGADGGVVLDVRDGLDRLAFDARTGRVTIVDAGSGLNFLGDRGDGTLVEFIQDFDVSGAIAGLGELAAQSNFRARPGVELTSSGTVTLASNWNLGAGTVDVDSAVADGLMTVDPVLGKPSVNFGREGELLRDYAAMTYRTGGRATGEAGVLSLRARGDLTIKGTISDGFFQFRNQTDPEFIAIAAANGLRGYRLTPDLGYSPFDPSVTPDAWTPDTPPFGNVVVVDFNFGAVTYDRVSTVRPSTAPFSAEANSAAATGDDAAGSAELFPLLTGGRAVGASSYRLVAGADRASADPGQTLTGAAGTLSVEGLNSYVIAPSAAARAFVPGLSLGSSFLGIAPQDVVSALTALSAQIAGLDENSFVSIPSFDPALLQALGDIAAETLPADGYTLAIADFVNTFDSYLTLPYRNLQPFLAAVGGHFDRLNVADPSLLPDPVGQARTAHYRNIVRTGAGRIDLAAAGSVDLRGGDPVYVRFDDSLTSDATLGGNKYLIGGSAVYSAGQRAALGISQARDPSGRVVTIDLGALPQLPNTLRDNLPVYTYDVVDTNAGARAGPAGVLVGDLSFAENGGDVSIIAGVDVLSRRDEARSSVFSELSAVVNWRSPQEGWRQGDVGGAGIVRINPQGFHDGVGSLAGGDVTILAGRDLSDVTAVATTSLAGAPVEGDAASSRALVTFGSGDVSIIAGRDILGGRVDVASGRGEVAAGGAIASAGLTGTNIGIPFENVMRLRLADATIDVSAGSGADVSSIGALGVASAALQQNAYGFYTPVAGVSILANGDIQLRNEGDINSSLPIWPGSLRAVSTNGDLTITRQANAALRTVQLLMVPSAHGQLELLAGGDIAPFTLAMSDEDASLLPGLFFSAIAEEFRDAALNRSFEFPSYQPFLSEGERRRRHAETPVHAGDPDAARVVAGRDITGVFLSTPKQTRISAGRDIVDMVFFGQNLRADDITQIRAGRDIIGTTRQVAGPNANLIPPRATLQGNTFQIGGPGSFILEAGRNAGPFLNSATVTPSSPLAPATQTDYGGGVLSVGNEDNPWLAAEGADVSVMFGVGKGVAWSALRDYYLDPANAPELSDELFTQPNGAVDRARPIYSVKLLDWMKANEPIALEAAAAGGDQNLAAAFTGFKTLGELRQRAFLTDMYFAELRATADPDGPSFQQYQRGYRAVNLLFPARLGYTGNDLTGGANGANERVLTGDLDLRLATIQTSRGGDVNLFGPGGDVLAGSVVRTADQVGRRNYDSGRLFAGLPVGDLTFGVTAIDAIPPGYEGLLTVRGGAINSFTDGDVRLNQSRLFTQGGGDISLWSSNGDLNGGEGPKTSSNFPPVVVDVSYNGFSVVDSRGSATGAGIAAFQPSIEAEAPDIYLMAPRGTVDFGAAGLRVAGNINVAALQVVNADNIQVGGVAVGVPTAAIAPTGALTEASNANAAAGQETSNQAAGGEQASIIIVEVLGYGGGEGVRDCSPQDDPNCKQAQP